MKPGELMPGQGSVQCNRGRTAVTVNVENTSDRTVQVCSHYHFFEANKRLRFDRLATYGRRLDIPAAGVCPGRHFPVQRRNRRRRQQSRPDALARSRRRPPAGLQIPRTVQRAAGQARIRSCVWRRRMERPAICRAIDRDRWPLCHPANRPEPTMPGPI